MPYPVGAGQRHRTGTPPATSKEGKRYTSAARNAHNMYHIACDRLLQYYAAPAAGILYPSKQSNVITTLHLHQCERTRQKRQ